MTGGVSIGEITYVELLSSVKGLTSCLAFFFVLLCTSGVPSTKLSPLLSVNHLLPLSFCRRWHEEATSASFTPCLKQLWMKKSDTFVIDDECIRREIPLLTNNLTNRIYANSKQITSTSFLSQIVFSIRASLASMTSFPSAEHEVATFSNDWISLFSCIHGKVRSCITCSCHWWHIVLIENITAALLNHWW